MLKRRTEIQTLGGQEMSQTSESGPPIMAKAVAVLDCKEEQIKPQQLNLRQREEQENDRRRTLAGLTTSTISETSGHSSSLLWTPQILPENFKRSSKRRSYRKKHRNCRRLWNDREMDGMNDETSPFLTNRRHHTYLIKPEELCSFERDYQHNRASHRRRIARSTEINSSKRSRKHKKRSGLNNDYTKYEYHRRSNRDKRRKHETMKQQKDEMQSSAKIGLPKFIQRIKDFFFGKKSEKGQYQVSNTPEGYHRSHFPEHSRHGKNHRRHHSEKLFRCASDSDIEVVKHHQRRQHRNVSIVQDDLCKSGRHWKAKRIRNENKLSSICESSDKTGGLERGFGSDGRLVLAKSGSTTYNDFKLNGGHKNNEYQRDKKDGWCKKDAKGTSEESNSQTSSRTKEKHRKHRQDYQNLKKKWTKQHQSFENDLEKLEKLIEMINMKKSRGFSSQKLSEDESLLERLEATQEKCVAEVDFTRHVLVCKLQRLENKVDERLSAVDSNNNTTEGRQNSVEDIREHMSKECRELRKLLQETSDQLRHVLNEKPDISQTNEDTLLINNISDSNKQGKAQEDCIPRQKSLNQQRQSSHSDALGNPDIPFPELSHHPLNNSNTTTSVTTRPLKDDKQKRISTYV